MVPLRVVSRAYAAFAWLIAGIAVLHMATTWRLTSASSFTKVWFFGAGVAMAQTAALNLLHRVHGRSVVSLAVVTRASNALMLALATVAGVVTGASIAQLVVMLGSIAALLVLSFSKSAFRSHSDDSPSSPTTASHPTRS